MCIHALPIWITKDWQAHERSSGGKGERESERDCEERKIEKPENIEKKTIAQLSRHTEWSTNKWSATSNTHNYVCKIFCRSHFSIRCCFRFLLLPLFPILCSSRACACARALNSSAFTGMNEEYKKRAAQIKRENRTQMTMYGTIKSIEP